MTTPMPFAPRCTSRSPSGSAGWSGRMNCPCSSDFRRLNDPRAGVDPSCRLGLVHGLDAVERLAEIAFGDLDVVIVLKIGPKLGGRAERLAKPKRCVGGDPGLLTRNPLDPRAWQAACLGERSGGHVQRDQKFFP